MRHSTEAFGRISRIFYVNVDLGSRGRCRVLFTPKNLDTISTGRVSGIHAFDYGGSWKNSFIFYVNVESERKRTSRICFRIQCCAWSDGSEFCSGASSHPGAWSDGVIHTRIFSHGVGLSTPFEPQKESFTSQSYSQAVHGTLFWVLCGIGRVVGSWPFWSCGIKARRSSHFFSGMGRDDSVAPSRIELTRRVIIVSDGRGFVRTTCRPRCPPWVSPDEYKRVRFFLQLSTCGGRCGVIVADCCGSGREFLNVLWDLLLNVLGLRFPA